MPLKTLVLAVAAMSGLVTQSEAFQRQPITRFKTIASPAPTGLTAVADARGVLVGWSATAGSTGYIVLRSDDGVKFGALTALIPATNYLDGKVVPGRTLYYQVAAVYPNGSQGISAAVAFQVSGDHRRDSARDEPARAATGATQPAAITPNVAGKFVGQRRLPMPSGFSGRQAGPNIVDLKWNAVAGATGYALFGPSLPATGKQVAGISQSVPNLAKGQYTFFVATGDDSGIQSTAGLPQTTVTVGNWATFAVAPNLYQEASAQGVYVIHNGKKVWIPTPDALTSMGYGWGSVFTIADGGLAAIPTFRIPSLSPTPGSVVYPPQGKAAPLRGVPGATRLVSRGFEIQHIALQGWLRQVDESCSSEPDFHYSLELDTDWALAQGIDLNALYKVGNVVRVGIPLPGYTPRRMVSLPVIHVELNGWGWGAGVEVPAGLAKPGDWTTDLNGCKLPFDPTLGGRLTVMVGGVTAADRGPYVRMSGSLVADHPHDNEAYVAAFFSKIFGIQVADAERAEWVGSVGDWMPGVPSSSPTHYARWTEIHPPDLIEILPSPPPRVTVRGVALAARNSVPGECQEVSFDLTPDAPRPPGANIQWQEFRGPETLFPPGVSGGSGSWITPLTSPGTSGADKVNIRARVCGQYAGSPGRFKAIYRVWWQ